MSWSRSRVVAAITRIKGLLVQCYGYRLLRRRPMKRSSRRIVRERAGRAVLEVHGWPSACGVEDDEPAEQSSVAAPRRIRAADAQIPREHQITWGGRLFALGRISSVKAAGWTDSSSPWTSRRTG